MTAPDAWLPLATLPSDHAMHVIIRTPDGIENSWRYLPYKPDARRQGYPHGRWQIATEYSFRNETLPAVGEWRPNPAVRREA